MGVLDFPSQNNPVSVDRHDQQGDFSLNQASEQDHASFAGIIAYVQKGEVSEQEMLVFLEIVNEADLSRYAPFMLGWCFSVLKVKEAAGEFPELANEISKALDKIAETLQQQEVLGIKNSDFPYTKTFGGGVFAEPEELAPSEEPESFLLYEMVEVLSSDDKTRQVEVMHFIIHHSDYLEWQPKQDLNRLKRKLQALQSSAKPGVDALIGQALYSVEKASEQSNGYLSRYTSLNAGARFELVGGYRWGGISGDNAGFLNLSIGPQFGYTARNSLQILGSIEYTGMFAWNARESQKNIYQSHGVQPGLSLGQEGMGPFVTLALPIAYDLQEKGIDIGFRSFISYQLFYMRFGVMVGSNNLDDVRPDLIVGAGVDVVISPIIGGR